MSCRCLQIGHWASAAPSNHILFNFVTTGERVHMLVVGLTGGIASGKSTVSRMFEQAGIPVICADELAREVVRPGSQGLAEIRRIFGDDVLDEEGKLDREAMARLVFQDRSKRKILESIIHPRVAEEQNKRLRTLEVKGIQL